MSETIRLSDRLELILYGDTGGDAEVVVDGRTCQWINSALADALVAACIPATDLPEHCWRAPGDDRLFAFRRHAAALREAGGTICYVDTGGPMLASLDGRYPDAVIEVRFPPPAPATEEIDTRLAKGRTLPDGRQILCTGDSGDEGSWFRCYGEGEATHAPTVTVLVDGAL